MGDTRQEILDASLVLFADQGYDKTSLREIAEQVGVTKAALYYHFPSKEEILVALFEPVAAIQDGLLEDLRSDALLDPAAWMPSLERLLGAILENRRLFGLLERNANTLMALNHEGTFAETPPGAAPPHRGVLRRRAHPSRSAGSGWPAPSGRSSAWSRSADRSCSVTTRPTSSSRWCSTSSVRS